MRPRSAENIVDTLIRELDEEAGCRTSCSSGEVTTCMG